MMQQQPKPFPVQQSQGLSNPPASATESGNPENKPQNISGQPQTAPLPQQPQPSVPLGMMPLRYPYPYMGQQMMYPMPFLGPAGPMQPMQMAQPLPQPQQNQGGQTLTSDLKDMLQQAIKAFQKNSSDTNSVKEDDLSSLRDENDLDFEREYSLEDENLKNIWSGFLTKNKQDRIGVDFYQIRGNISENFNSESYLNVSHRTQYDEIMKRPYLGIVAISPQNVTQCETFKKYVDYFSEKQRAGVINFKNCYTLYILPPSDFSRKFYQNPKKHLLGILVNSTVESKPYVDMEKLNLPPPVISSTEKKLLAKQQKQITANSENA